MGVTLSAMPNPLPLHRAGVLLVVGFMPGYDREEVSPGVVKRVYEAGYVNTPGTCGRFPSSG